MLIKQFSDKIKAQATRLQSLESYKQLCEHKLQELGFSLPLSEDAQPQHSSSMQDLKR